MTRYHDWSGWLPEPTDFEQRMAAALLGCEPGDEIRLDHGAADRDGEVTVRSVSDRAAVTELRCTHDLTFWVVRERYVFVTTADGKPLFVGWAGADRASREDDIDWQVAGERLTPDGGVAA